MNRFKNGFTLIELITVILIIGILSAIALANFGRTFNTLSQGEELKKIITNIEFARDYAMAREERCRLFVEDTDHRYSLFHGVTEVPDTPVPLPGNRESLYQVRLPDFLRFLIPQDIDLTFDSHGEPESEEILQFSTGKSIIIEHPSGYVHAQ